MRAVIQRVSRATITSRVGEPDQVAASITTGLAVLIGFETDDPPDTPAYAADRVAKLRIFPDNQGRMNRALTDLANDTVPTGSVAAVPNFTLAADPAEGRRPAFTGAMPPDQAASFFNTFINELSARLPASPHATGHPEVALGPVAAGVFGSHMHLDLTNDGPVTLVLQHPPLP